MLKRGRFAPSCVCRKSRCDDEDGGDGGGEQLGSVSLAVEEESLLFWTES